MMLRRKKDGYEQALEKALETGKKIRKTFESMAFRARDEADMLRGELDDVRLELQVQQERLQLAREILDGFRARVLKLTEATEKDAELFGLPRYDTAPDVIGDDELRAEIEKMAEKYCC
jgi:chromosome segregation ATPase